MDLDAYKVSPYTPVELPPIDSAGGDSKHKLENLVLDYSAATSQGGEILKRDRKSLSRGHGHRMAHSTGGGGHDSQTTLTALSSIT